MKTQHSGWVVAIVAVGGWMLAASPVRAAIINGDQDVTAAGAVLTFTDTGGVTLARDGSNVYDWNNLTGYEASGLALGDHSILAAPPAGTVVNIALNLRGGSVTADGAAASTVSLATARNSSSTAAGYIALENAGSVTLGGVDASNLSGVAGSFTLGFASDGTSVVNVLGAINTSAPGNAGDVSIGSASLRAATITIGAIDARTTTAGATYGGAVALYSTGSVEVTNGISMGNRKSKNLLIDQTSGSFTAGVIDATANSDNPGHTLNFYGGDKSGAFAVTRITAPAGSVSSYVLTIRDYASVSVTPGSGTAIDVGGGVGGTSTTSTNLVNITGIGFGGVALGNLSTAQHNISNTYSGSIVIGNVAGGGVTVGDIDTSNGLTSNGRAGGDVTIYGVTGSVTVGSVDASGDRNVAYQTGDLRIGYQANDALAAVVGDIAVTGALDLNSANSNAYDGLVKLAATGNITLGSAASPGANTLDLSKVKSVLFNSGGGQNVIYDEIDASGGNAVSQFILAGGTGAIYYYYQDGGVNSVLYANAGLGNNGVYALAGGGTLQPLATIPEPATVAFLAAGGLGLIGAAVRRRRRA